MFFFTSLDIIISNHDLLGVFEPLKNIYFFMHACTILNGTLAWDVTGTRDSSKCLDIDPEMLYGLENVREKIA